MDELIEGNYDYVAIWYAGDEFSLNFGDCFENPADINSNSLYFLDVNSRKLKLCR